MALQFLWIRVSFMWISSTYDTSRTSNRSMSIIGGRLFGLLVLEVIRGLYMEDKAGHGKHHTTDSNIYWSFNTYVPFSLIFATPLLMTCVSNIFRLGSSNTFCASPVGLVCQLILRICHVRLHFLRSEGTMR